MRRHYKTLPIPRDKKSNGAVDVIIVLMYFVVITLLFLLLAKHGSAALPCKRFINEHISDLSVQYSYTTPHLNG